MRAMILSESELAPRFSPSPEKPRQRTLTSARVSAPILIAILLGWVVWAFVARWLLDNPREDPITGVLYRLTQGYCAGVHRLEVSGIEHVPTVRHPGPLVVVCNHTAGVDPLLILSAVRFEVRWMMGLDMMVPGLDAFWRWAGIIAVNRKGRDLAGTREALRHLERGGVLGVFPEGGLERPPHRLRKFHTGVGFIIAQTGAPVLPAWIDGTPVVEPAWASLWHRGHARVRFGPIMRFDDAKPAEITARIREWFEATSGWPSDDRDSAFPA